jgi:hypothetical protein
MGKKRLGDRLPPFVPLTWEMLNSKAYKDLPSSAGKELPYYLGKVKTAHNDPQKYLIEFSFSYREANRYGFATTTHHRTICELIRKGFLDPCDKGGLRSDGRSYNLFRLSRRWERYGSKDFEEIEWQAFTPRKTF